LGDTAVSAGRGLLLFREAIPLMADFDESAIRSPTRATETIRAGDLKPWMVWSAGGVIAALAVLGLYLGMRGGHPESGVALTLARGEVLNPATVAAATPAVALPKDQQWSTLSGPEIITKAQASPKADAGDETDSDEDASDEPAAAAAAVADEAETPADSPAQTTPPTPAAEPQTGAPTP
jgi:hypothetical protein